MVRLQGNIILIHIKPIYYTTEQAGKIHALHRSHECTVRESIHLAFAVRFGTFGIKNAKQQQQVVYIHFCDGNTREHGAQA